MLFNERREVFGACPVLLLLTKQRFVILSRADHSGLQTRLAHISKNLYTYISLVSALTSSSVISRIILCFPAKFDDGALSCFIYSWKAALYLNTAVSFKSNITKLYCCWPSFSILLFKEIILISYLLRLLVCRVVAMPEIKFSHCKGVTDN